MIHVPVPLHDREVRYYQIYPDCGLSHRAEMEGPTLDFYGVICAGCGTSSYDDWPCYHIGSNESYRRYPDADFARLADQRAIDASPLAFRRRLESVENIPGTVPRSTSSTSTATPKSTRASSPSSSPNCDDSGLALHNSSPNDSTGHLPL